MKKKPPRLCGRPRKGPAAYAVSVAKQCAVRRLQDVAARTPFCGLQAGLLPAVLYRHNSLIRRTLGNTRPELQENKAVNLALAATKVNGALLRPGQVFSFWHMVGSVTAKKGYREGLTISELQRRYAEELRPSRPAGSVPGLSPSGALRHRHLRLL